MTVATVIVRALDRVRERALGLLCHSITQIPPWKKQNKNCAVKVWSMIRGIFNIILKRLFADLGARTCPSQLRLQVAVPGHDSIEDCPRSPRRKERDRKREARCDSHHSLHSHHSHRPQIRLTPHRRATGFSPPGGTLIPGTMPSMVIAPAAAMGRFSGLPGGEE